LVVVRRDARDIATLHRRLLGAEADILDQDRIIRVIDALISPG